MSSDSEGFESADEGHIPDDRMDRKHRKSSSTYSDSALEKDLLKNTSGKPLEAGAGKKKNFGQETDGWDDFYIEANEPASSAKAVQVVKSQVSKTDTNRSKTGEQKSQDTGWDDFGDWGDGNTTDSQKEYKQPDPVIKEVTEGLAATTTSGWGWGGWGVDSLLSSATAGISNISNQVSQGISTVLETVETGIGAPDPEELARMSKEETKEGKEKDEEAKPDKEPSIVAESGDGSFPFGSILKFVGSTGSKVISGGLNTLETIGRKTMEVLEENDPGLAKKRALFGFDPDKPVLSKILREAKAKADEEDRIKEEKREAKEVHYENLFDDFEGLVHLEALEILSQQVSMRIEERLRSAGDRQEMKETLQQVTELCEMPESDDEEDDESENQSLKGLPKDEAFLVRLQKATQDLGVKLQFQPLVKQYTDILEWLSTIEEPNVEKILYKRAISSLAQATALCVQLYHKAAEMLLVKPRRSTADEADALMQMTVVLKNHTNELSVVFTQKIDSIATFVTAKDANAYITNIYLEADNSATYIQNAFQLTLPIIQIGAV